MVLYGVVWCCFVVWFVWCCMVLYGVVWCCMVLYGVVWCCMVLYDVVWCCMVLYGVVLCCMVLNLNKDFKNTAPGILKARSFAISFPDILLKVLEYFTNVEL